MTISIHFFPSSSPGSTQRWDQSHSSFLKPSGRIYIHDIIFSKNQNCNKDLGNTQFSFVLYDPFKHATNNDHLSSSAYSTLSADQTFHNLGATKSEDIGIL